ncbi:MAG: hypothetical protein ACE5NA_07620 [Nitrospiraceae bacterium]
MMLVSVRSWCPPVLAFVVSLCPPLGLAFEITSPVAGTVLQSGQDLPVSVDLHDEVGIVKVQYFWYKQEEEPAPLQLATPALVSTDSESPPYGGTLQVPIEAFGVMRLLAVAEVARGRLAGRIEFDEIEVQVKAGADLVRIDFDVAKPWRLQTIGKLLEVPVVGEFSDGVTRRLDGEKSFSTYQTSDENVVRIRLQRLMQVAGNGRALLTVTNQGIQGTLEILVKANAEPNHPPTANAGPDQTVRGRTKVVLDGLQSLDPDGDLLMYQWAQIRGHKVSLLDAGTAQASFLAPVVSARRLFRFRLRVTDMEGADTVKGADSLPSYVNIWVEP